jgi:5-methyltetrahydrofolate--homocysteine methyltransferase
MGISETTNELVHAIIAGNRKTSPVLTQGLLNEGVDAYSIVIDACSVAMAKVGELYQEGEYFVPEILMSAKAFEAAMTVLEPHLKESKGKASGTVVLGVCEGDIHTIGKNLVATMLEAAGFNVIDLGPDVAADRFAEAAVEHGADIIGASALMTTSMIGMKDIIEVIKSRNLAVKVMVGGGPVNRDYAESIGADGYGEDAKEAVDVALRLMEG